MSKARGWVLLTAGLALVLIPGGIFVYEKIRGIRNKNPGNVRWDGKTQWQGQDSPPADAQGFCRFKDVRDGIRCMTRVLYSKRARGVTTVRAIITEWAPASDNNNTAAYIQAVASALAVGPDVPLTYPAQLQPLVEAIITHENGIQPYSVDTIREGIARA